MLTVTERDGAFLARINDAALRAIDTHKLRAELAALNRPGKPPVVVLSMRNMDSLASGCLGVLAQLSTDLEHAGGVLVLYAVPREVSRILRKTRLDRVIHTARDRKAATKKAFSLRRKHGGEATRLGAA